MLTPGKTDTDVILMWRYDVPKSVERLTQLGE